MIHFVEYIGSIYGIGRSHSMEHLRMPLEKSVESP